jgi:hypothetical protein
MNFQFTTNKEIFDKLREGEMKENDQFPVPWTLDQYLSGPGASVFAFYRGN